MSEVQVRAAAPEDAVAMASIYVDAAREAWGHILGVDNLRALEPPTERLELRVCASSPREDVFVAEVEGTVRGFAITRPSSNEDAIPTRDGELDMIYTDPASWGQGIGRALLGAAADRMAAAGFAEATLWTAEENLRPRRVYEAAGWKPDDLSRERTWLGVRFRELRYRVILGPSIQHQR